MGAVTVSAFRVTGFVVPIHVKNNRAASVGFISRIRPGSARTAKRRGRAVPETL